MQLSVIIPTRDRKEKLFACLAALAAQECGGASCEVLVADDGSSDGTCEEVAALAASYPHGLRCLRQEGSGPAAARNAGITAAHGELLLFTGDDIMAAPGLLAAHLVRHKALPGNAAVLGYTTWPPGLKVTPLMRWLEESGTQFSYGSIKDPGNVSYNYFYTSNVSVKRKFLLENGMFCTDFPAAAWEDIELAYRLEGKGMRLVYAPEAVAYHDHPYGRDAFERRCRTVGHCLRVFHAKHPELPRVTGEAGGGLA